MSDGVPYGNYQLVRRIGGGAMAEVFLARRSGHKGFEKRLVIKRLMPHLSANPRFAEMFVKEAQLAALIDHPNLAHVSDFGEVAGTYYLAMEYVEGLTLADFLGCVGRISSGVAARIGIDLLEALHAIHTARSLEGSPMRLVHRDVSTRNTMLRGDGVVKLLDFGIAIPSDVKPSGEKIGTRGFMSPEQMAGQAIDARSDLYSVGVLLYRMISGGMPPEGDPEPSLSNVPRALAEIISAALAIQPDERPGTARQMQAALEAIVSTSGVEGTRAHLAELVTSARRASSNTDARLKMLRGVTRMTRMTRSLSDDDSDDQRRSNVPRIAIGSGLAIAAVAAVAAVWLWLPRAEQAAPIAAPEPPLDRAAIPAPILVQTASTASIAIATPERVKKRRSKAVGSGTLAVDTSPWSEVFLDGRRLGVTPLEAKSLPSGVHELELVSNETGRRKKLRVVIRPNTVTSVYRELSKE